MRLYLIPTPISDNREMCTISYNIEIVRGLDFFIVENLRTARRFIAGLKIEKVIDDIHFEELSEQTTQEMVEDIIKVIIARGSDCGLLSEAGLPCVADPGGALVRAAHRHGIEVVPLVGASSLMLALMASGANGQKFAFNGYLPIKQPARDKAIANFQKRLATEGQTQIFIETPYRNDTLLRDFVRILPNETFMTVAVGLNSTEQKVLSRPISQWKRELPTIGKTPAIFILG